MNIKRSIQSFVLCVFLLSSSYVLAGGPEPLPPNPWIIYMGGFGGYYHATYQYETIYFDSSPQNQLISNEIRQRGMTLGGQIGVQYHFKRAYEIGLEFSGMGNAEKARSSDLVFGGGGFSISAVDTTLRINHNLDLTGFFGIDVTPTTSIYVKGGASYARLIQNLTAFVPAPPPTGTFFQQTTRRNLWGFVVGLGLIRSINRWVDFFGEYDFYDYGNRSLNTLNNVIGFPIPAGGVSVYHQDANNIRAYTIRAGLNVNFSV